eukprot:TRINITY_DN5905_c0_g2_i2.p1 TRINITY_DN5905_c0_g2~~TRINITY_DN5905_c0_g2_i2.p1  ORF type:complete len:670 (-),score=116.21 TRINITY_DN5905_c0_g2_i2:248-2257(-)
MVSGTERPHSKAEYAPSRPFANSGQPVRAVHYFASKVPTSTTTGGFSSARGDSARRRSQRAVVSGSAAEGRQQAPARPQLKARAGSGAEPPEQPGQVPGRQSGPDTTMGPGSFEASTDGGAVSHKPRPQTAPVARGREVLAALQEAPSETEERPETPSGLSDFSDAFSQVSWDAAAHADRRPHSARIGGPRLGPLGAQKMVDFRPTSARLMHHSQAFSAASHRIPEESPVLAEALGAVAALAKEAPVSKEADSWSAGGGTSSSTEGRRRGAESAVAAGAGDALASKTMEALAAQDISTDLKWEGAAALQYAKGFEPVGRDGAATPSTDVNCCGEGKRPSTCCSAFSSRPPSSRGDSRAAQQPMSIAAQAQAMADRLQSYVNFTPPASVPGSVSQPSSSPQSVASVGPSGTRKQRPQTPRYAPSTQQTPRPSAAHAFPTAAGTTTPRRSGRSSSRDGAATQGKVRRTSLPVRQDDAARAAELSLQLEAGGRCTSPQPCWSERQCSHRASSAPAAAKKAASSQGGGSSGDRLHAALADFREMNAIFDGDLGCAPSSSPSNDGGSSAASNSRPSTSRAKTPEVKPTRWEPPIPAHKTHAAKYQKAQWSMHLMPSNAVHFYFNSTYQRDYDRRDRPEASSCGLKSTFASRNINMVSNNATCACARPHAATFIL